MICKGCQKGAVLYLEEKDQEAQASHAECPGDAWCDCQHKKPPTGPVWARS